MLAPPSVGGEGRTARSKYLVGHWLISLQDRAMGGRLELIDAREQSGEPVADILVRHSRLKGIEIVVEEVW